MRSGVVVAAAVLCGVAVAVQAQFTGVMQRQMGTLEATFITYFSGGMVIGLVMLLARSRPPDSASERAAARPSPARSR